MLPGRTPSSSKRFIRAAAAATSASTFGAETTVSPSGGAVGAASRSNTVAGNRPSDPGGESTGGAWITETRSPNRERIAFSVRRVQNHIRSRPSSSSVSVIMMRRFWRLIRSSISSWVGVKSVKPSTISEFTPLSPGRSPVSPARRSRASHICPSTSNSPFACR